jgi:hypothetical protein
MTSPATLIAALLVTSAGASSAGSHIADSYLGHLLLSAQTAHESAVKG